MTMRMARRLFSGIAALCIVPLLWGCGDARLPSSEPITKGNPRLGKELVARYGCAACHTISGIAQANATVGPPLKGISDRVYIGGVAPNTSDNLIRWIMHPRELSPKTAMPDLGVSETDARNIAAYLYSTQ